MSAFRWTWAGDGVSKDFESKQQAEDWLGREWRELLEKGVLEVVLTEDGTTVYAMKLTAE